MEVWRPEVIAGRRPEVLCKTTLVQALVLHVAAFLAFVIFGWVNGLFEKEPEKIEIIDLTIVVNENLNGEENEPPPLKNPPPPQPKPKPKPQPKETKKPEPPKALEQIVTNVVKKVEKKEEKKKEPPKKKDEPKKEEPKKPEPPKKTKEELMKERIEKMRNSAVKNKTPVKIEVPKAKESGNGRTEKALSQAEIEKALRDGARAGTSNQLAPNELSRCVSLIKMAISDKWDRLAPKVGNSGTVVLTCRLNSAGGLVNVRVTKSCGDKLSDQAALTVARSVSSIAGLSQGFIVQHQKEDISIYYRVEGR